MGRNVRISQPILVSGGAFGFSNSPESSFSVEPGDAPLSPIDRHSQSPRFAGSAESIASAAMTDTPPVVASYQDYKSRLARLSVDSSSSHTQVSTFQPRSSSLNQRKRPPADLKRSSTVIGDTTSKRSSIFPWKRSGAAATSNSTAPSSYDKNKRSSVITISSPVLEYSTSALVQKQRLSPIVDHRASYSEQDALPTPETSYSLSKESPKAPSNFSPSPANNISLNLTDRPDGPIVHTRSASKDQSKSSTALSQANEQISQLKTKLKQSEAKRRDLLIEYQQKLDTERRRNLALQRRMNELTESRDVKSSQQAQIKELEHQRDILRKALLHMKESKNIEIHEYKERLSRSATIASSEKKTDKAVKTIDGTTTQPKTMKTLKSSASNSSMGSANQKDKLACSFATLNMGISPLLPIENTMDFKKNEHYIKDFFDTVPSASAPKFSDAAVF